MARVLVTSRLAVKSLDTTWRDLLEQAGHEVVIAQVPQEQMYPTEEQLKDLLQGITATVASSESYTRAVFESAPELRVVSRVGVGYDAIDTAAAADHDVVAMIAAGSNDTTVAESAVAMILALARELYAYITNTAEGDWSRGLMNEIRDKTIGVVGLGRIGKSVVRRLAGFDPVLIAAEPYPDQEFVAQYGIELVEIDDLFRRADYVTLHVNTTPDTVNFVNERRLGLMKPTAYLVNTARGGLVDEDALYAALTQGVIAGAALDVRAKEPPSDHRLAQLPNVIATPHVAGISTDCVVRMADLAAQNIVDVLQGSWRREMVVNGLYSD
ncbi:MAG: phosphoglycerate dehydrogenase [Chloroflexi bacterium]|nr:phosphoglycerate dehydrogenase [Chloroflexota bacterium]